MSGTLVSGDADVFRYMIGFAAQQTKWKVRAPDGELLRGVFKTKTNAKAKYGKDMVNAGYKFEPKVIPEKTSFALHSCKQQIEHIIKQCNARKLKLYLTSGDKTNFRIKRGRFLPYKGGRLLAEARQPFIDRGEFLHAWAHYDKINAQAKPYHYDALTDYLRTQWGAIEIEGMEADDELTIQQTKAWTWAKNKRNPERALRKHGHIVATIDKDLQQAPGWFFDFRSKERRAADRPDWKFVSKYEGDLSLWTQVITGDMTDWIYGIRGIGGVKAREELLKVEPSEYRRVTQELYDLWWLDMTNAADSKEGFEHPFEKVLFETYKNSTEYMEEVYDLIYLFRNYDEANAKIKEWV